MNQLLGEAFVLFFTWLATWYYLKRFTTVFKPNVQYFSLLFFVKFHILHQLAH